MNPSERIAFFFDAVNRKDVDAAMSCYEPEAVLSLVPSGGTVSGLDQIREALAGFFTFEMSFSDVRELCSFDGKVALTALNWTAAGTGPDGEAITMSGQSTEVMRRQADGEWLLAIDSPWWAS